MEGASIMNGKNKCKILKDIRRQIAQLQKRLEEKKVPREKWGG